MKMDSESFKSLMAEEALLTRAQGLIVEAMQRAGLNQRELAKRLRISEAAVSKMLGEETNLTMRRFARVMHALDDTAQLSSAEFEKTRAARICHQKSRKAEDRWVICGLSSGALTEHALRHANENHQSEWSTDNLTGISFSRGSPRRADRYLARAVGS